MKDLKVGDKLFFKSTGRNGHNDRDLVITSIGRKWIHLKRSDDRFNFPWGKMNKDTWQVDGNGYSSPGRCWLKKNDAEEYANLQEEWRNFYIEVSKTYHRPESLSAEDLKYVRELLHMDKAI